jgi:hypothetical protein
MRLAPCGNAPIQFLSRIDFLCSHVFIHMHSPDVAWKDIISHECYFCLLIPSASISHANKSEAKDQDCQVCVGLFFNI